MTKRSKKNLCWLGILIVVSFFGVASYVNNRKDKAKEEEARTEHARAQEEQKKLEKIGEYLTHRRCVLQECVSMAF